MKKIIVTLFFSLLFQQQVVVANNINPRFVQQLVQSFNELELNQEGNLVFKQYAPLLEQALLAIPGILLSSIGIYLTYQKMKKKKLKIHGIKDPAVIDEQSSGAMNLLKKYWKEGMLVSAGVGLLAIVCKKFLYEDKYLVQALAVDGLQIGLEQTIAWDSLDFHRIYESNPNYVGMTYDEAVTSMVNTIRSFIIINQCN